jgi:hypothetical protein
MRMAPTGSSPIDENVCGLQIVAITGVVERHVRVFDIAQRARCEDLDQLVDRGDNVALRELKELCPILLRMLIP